MAEPMGQCLHLDASARQCKQQAAEGELFCWAHQSGDRPEVAWRKWVFRLAALVLLLLFVLQSYLLLKTLLG